MKNRLKHAVGARLQQVREALGLNRKQFAALLLVARSTIHHNETGASFPRPQLLHILAEETGTSLQWLLCGSGEMFPKPPPVEPEITDFMGQNDAVTAMVAAMKENEGLMFHLLAEKVKYLQEK